MARKKSGLVLIFTGKGKGKSTAAFGTVFRSWGHGYQSCVIQFMKSDTGKWGEVKAAQKAGIEWHQIGEGFSWSPEKQEQSVIKAREGWLLAQKTIKSKKYDLIVLDEFTYPLDFGWLDTTEVINWLQLHKPPQLHLIITGRSAPDSLLDYGDLVTEMKNLKHPFDQGRKATRGIEF